MKKSETLIMYGGQSRKTLTVAGLIDVLSSFDPELPVAAMWEGVECPLKKESIYETTLGCAPDKPVVLYLDVDEHF